MSLVNLFYTKGQVKSLKGSLNAGESWADEIIQKDLQVPGGILTREEALLLALSVFISKRHFFPFFHAFICPSKQR